jgi:hypothetical protein
VKFKLIAPVFVLGGIVIGMIMSACAEPAAGESTAVSGIYSRSFPEYQTVCFAVQRHYSGVAIAIDCIEWPRK